MTTFFGKSEFQYKLPNDDGDIILADFLQSCNGIVEFVSKFIKIGSQASNEPHFSLFWHRVPAGEERHPRQRHGEFLHRNSFIFVSCFRKSDEFTSPIHRNTQPFRTCSTPRRKLTMERWALRRMRWCGWSGKLRLFPVACTRVLFQWSGIHFRLSHGDRCWPSFGPTVRFVGGSRSIGVRENVEEASQFYSTRFVCCESRGFLCRSLENHFLFRSYCTQRHVVRIFFNRWPRVESMSSTSVSTIWNDIYLQWGPTSLLLSRFTVDGVSKSTTALKLVLISILDLVVLSRVSLLCFKNFIRHQLPHFLRLVNAGEQRFFVILRLVICDDNFLWTFSLRWSLIIGFAI